MRYNKTMSSQELRKKFIEFFESKGHVVVPSSSLIPDDPSVLLTTAGMQQFKPYYTGAADPMTSPHPTLQGKPIGSKNAVSIQKCFRTSDIDEVGDESHDTFFEMLGNFSFGAYFKKEAIQYAKEFFDLINLSIEYVTVFGGDEKMGIPPDEESEKIWKELDIQVRKCGREDNFWGPTGAEGPCGPTTELYVGGVEIWNIVFNEYYCDKEGKFSPLEEKGGVRGVDTGMGLERLSMASQKVPTIFDTDLFAPLIKSLPTAWADQRMKRILVDHARGIAFLISDGVRPSNKDQGYILRKLIRRSIVLTDIKQGTSFSGGDTLPMGVENDIRELLSTVFDEYVGTYTNLNKELILSIFNDERKKFGTAFRNGLREMKKVETIDGISAFKLYESYSLPFEVIKDLGGDKAKYLTRKDFDTEFQKHQEISRAGREKKFGGHGLLLDTGELKAGNEEELKKVTRLHTATHLLQAALRKVLGGSVHQDGSDITAERLRFDFTFPRALTEEELQEIGKWVNDVVQKDVPMGFEEMPFEDAKKSGALYFEKEKYPTTVKVYTAGDPKTGEVYSKELCGGPHVSHTGELKKFVILKQESVSAGVRRIRATVMP